MEDTDLILPIFVNDLNNKNIINEAGISKMQTNLIMMGFDINMINKIISIFKIKTEEEAIDYLIKSEDGMWNHPFIPKEDTKEEKNNILNQPINVMNNALTTLNTIKKNISFGNNSEDLKNEINEININENDILKINENICEICGESKDFHLIKEYKTEKTDNVHEDNKLFDDINDEDINLINESDKNNNNNKEDNIIIKEDEKDEEEMDDNPNMCKICMDDLENPIEIETCKHKFCQECFHSYLINLIKNNTIDQIPCPKNKCKNIKLSENYFSQFLTEREYFKYRQFKAQNEIARDKKKIFCPLCNSYADIGERQLDKFDSNNPDYIKTTLKCKNNHEFCSCGRPLHEGDCYHDEKEFKDFVINEKIKKCPKCGFLIKKNDGCNHMTCGNPICKYEFCWLCMQEAVPNHFDYGPCAGKQFFDPDSFSYQLKLNHPFLYIIYCIFVGIFFFILFVICCMALPFITLAVISFVFIFEEDIFETCPDNSKIIIYLGYVVYGFALETLVYIAWGIFFAGVGLCIVALILALIFAFVKCIFNCCCCMCYEENNGNPRDNNNNIIDDLF